QTAAQTGLLGLAAFLWVWAAALTMIWRRRAEPLAAAAGAGVVGVLVYSVTNFPLQIEPTACWVFLSLGLAERGGDEREARVPGSPHSRAIVCLLVASAAAWWVVMPPFLAEIHRHRAGEAAAAGDWMNAERESRQAIALCRERSEKTAFDLGEMLRRQGRWEDALDAYRLSIRLRNYGEVYNSMANCWFVLWSRDRARLECRDEAVRLWRVAARLGLPRPEDQAAVEQNLRVIDRQARQVLSRP
ncbi:MAG: tetratricopeptide repeat protein, partial [bacterium]